MNDQSNLSSRVDEKIDALMAKLNSLVPQVDILTEKLARADAQAVRDAFHQMKQGGESGS